MRSDRRRSALLNYGLLAAALFATTAPAVPQDSVLLADPPRAIADFQLTDQNGQPRSLDDFRGTAVLVFFGFTNCPDICPTTLQQIRVLKQSPDPAVARTRVVMISVDGERDTPQKLKSYLESFSPSFVGLTGPSLKVRAIAAQFAAVFFKGPTEKSGGYQVQHTAQVYLLDGAGRLRATFANSPQETMRRTIASVSADSR